MKKFLFVVIVSVVKVLPKVASSETTLKPMQSLTTIISYPPFWKKKKEEKAKFRANYGSQIDITFRCATTFHKSLTIPDFFAPKAAFPSSNQTLKRSS